MKTWRCAQCGKLEIWGPGWSWYGSHLEMEFVVCSEACRVASAAELGVTPDVLDDMAHEAAPPAKKRRRASR